MSPDKVAEVLWAIFVDAQNYFSALAEGDVLPTSTLTFARHWLSSGSIKTTEGCPIQRLLGINQGYTPATQAEPTSMFGAAKPHSQDVPRINASPVAILIAAVKPIVAKHPKVSVKQIVDASDPPVTNQDCEGGGSGSMPGFPYPGQMHCAVVLIYALGHPSRPR
eukprot:scaffold26571_cov52-Attheya_sp.AAC.5